MKEQGGKKYKFKRHMSIGAMDAYEDEKYLSTCFVDTGDLARLLDPRDSKCIVVARTGGGKSALLARVAECEENVIVLQPNELALNYIANSNIIRFFENIGIKLDIFYQLLWRHVLVVELIRRKFDITNESNRKTFLDRIENMFFRDKSKQDAIEYLMQWGNKFWLETDKRIQELTTKLEEDLRATVDGGKIGVPISAQGSSSLSQEIKEEITQRAQSVVNGVQIQKLNQVIKLLAEDIFTDPQQRYYILIDRLDDDWVEDQTRYRLIRALIETVKTLKRIDPVKAIVSLRTDLLATVFSKTRDSGFQEEKYEDLILRLRWGEDELRELLDRRITVLIAEQYTSRRVLFSDIFTSRPNGEKPLPYILKRTLMRPRDAISFVNICIDEAHGKSEINTATIKVAEKIYSERRLAALCHEWYSAYPFLDQYVTLLKNKSQPFTHSDIAEEELDDVALSLSVAEKKANDPIQKLAVKMFEEKGPTRAAFRYAVMKSLFAVGVLGVKRASYTAVSWSVAEDLSLTDSEVKNCQHFEVHPMLHSVLGIFDRSRKGYCK